jgi:hypothetical protein
MPCATFCHVELPTDDAGREHQYLIGAAPEPFGGHLRHRATVSGALRSGAGVGIPRIDDHGANGAGIRRQNLLVVDHRRCLDAVGREETGGAAWNIGGDQRHIKRTVRFQSAGGCSGSKTTRK